MFLGLCTGSSSHHYHWYSVKEYQCSGRFYSHSYITKHDGIVTTFTFHQWKTRCRALLPWAVHISCQFVMFPVRVPSMVYTCPLHDLSVVISLFTDRLILRHLLFHRKYCISSCIYNACNIDSCLLCVPSSHRFVRQLQCCPKRT